MTAISSNPTVSTTQSWFNQECTSRWRKAIVTIAVISMHIFFPWMAIIAACSLAPASVALWIVPPVAVASIAAGFFGLKQAFPAAPCFTAVPVVPNDPTEPEEPAQPLPPGAPRGIRRPSGAMNCWANALFQILYANPYVKQCLSGSNCPQTLAAFQTFTKIYDKVVQEGRSFVRKDTQMLRECVVGSISARSGQQEDPSEALMAIHAALPNDLKAMTQVARTYRPGLFQPAIAGGNVRVSDEANLAYFSVPIRGKEPRLDHLVHAEFSSRKSFDATINGTEYRCVGEKLHFAEAPSFLWFHLKRFQYNQETGVTTKIDKAVTIPDTYTVKGQDWATKCELLSFIVHQSSKGTTDFGHYVAYTKDTSTGQWYEMDDAHVRAITGEEMRAKSQQAYLVQYVALQPLDRS